MDRGLTAGGVRPVLIFETSPDERARRIDHIGRQAGDEIRAQQIDAGVALRLGAAEQAAAVRIIAQTDLLRRG